MPWKAKCSLLLRKMQIKSLTRTADTTNGASSDGMSMNRFILPLLAAVAKVAGY
jgi:hypothetical protein